MLSEHGETDADIQREPGSLKTRTPGKRFTVGRILLWLAAGVLASLLFATVQANRSRQSAPVQQPQATVQLAAQPVISEDALAGDPVIAAAGDIACDPAASAFHEGLGTKYLCRAKYTSDLLVNTGLTAVLALGDNQYGCGGYTAFQDSYALGWGRVKSITRPVPGNHEYQATGGTDCGTNASGYFQYFGTRAGPQGQGYYSFNVGAWHIIALNSNCWKVGGCASGSPQYNWLKSDLASHTNKCVLAFWHHPLFSSGGYTNAGVKPLWNLLYSKNADVILNGHAHIYERFAPQTPAGAPDPVRGIREFIVGTGGSNRTDLGPTAPNSQVRNATYFGVLRLTLHAASYNWKFVSESSGPFTDSGSTMCH